MLKPLQIQVLEKHAKWCVCIQILKICLRIDYELVNRFKPTKIILSITL